MAFNRILDFKNGPGCLSGPFIWAFTASVDGAVAMISLQNSVRIYCYFPSTFRIQMIKEVQKLLRKVLILLLDILLFTWQVVRRVILPTRSRKDNVLSSLLTFFLGLLERIVSFEKSILQRPVVFTHKYVKQGLIIAVGFLFLLSSFEWTVGPSADKAVNGSPEVTACAQVGASVRTMTPRRIAFSVVAPMDAACVAHSYVSALDLTGLPWMGRRWLRFGVFRI